MTRQIAILLLAGSFFSLGRVKEEVTIGGVPVGGLPYDVAEKQIRAQLFSTLRPIVIHAPTGDVVLDGELSLTDDIASLVRKAKRGQTLSVHYSRNWADAEESLRALCALNAREAKNAEMTFSNTGFCYMGEVFGTACDYSALLRDVMAHMEEGGEVTLSLRKYAPAVTEEQLRQKTRELSRFSTSFDGSNLPRRHNIALAAARIGGTVLASNEEFSFNRIVGRRTAENGFRSANIISGGEFVPGIGGGVCQASTTLFGAALRAGMKITESRAHSLSVGYVPPSEDAMVSDASDLKFVNPYPFPVYILARTGQSGVTFSFYGMPDGRRYEVESRVLERISPPPPELVEEEEGVLRAEKEGIVSESFLVVYGKNGKLCSRTRIRKDRYAPVRGKLGIKNPPSPAGETEGSENG